MHYIKFPKVSGSGTWNTIQIYEEYRAWLEEHVGKEYDKWEWKRGDLCAVGVYISNPEAANFFKLKYGI